MKIKLLILMILALTVTACGGGISTDYVDKLEARITALEETVEKHNEDLKKVPTTDHCHHTTAMDYIRNFRSHTHDVC